MTKDELAGKIRQSFDVWNEHDVDGIARFYADGAIVRDAADPENAAKGSDAIRARAQMILNGFSDAMLEISTISVDGNRVCTEWRFSGTHDGEFLGVPASGRRIVNTGANVQEFDEDGKIASEHAYWDAALFMRQAGALSSTAATAAV